MRLRSLALILALSVGAEAAITVVMDGDYQVISFTTLGSFNYRSKRQTFRSKKKAPDNAPETSEIPDEVKALNEKKVAIQGYMMPIEFDDNKIKSFVLVPHFASCCFGGSPKMNMWVFVKTTKNTANKIDAFNYAALVGAKGTLEVGEKESDDVGFSIYRIRADKVYDVKD